jgi:hypothetical protein
MKWADCVINQGVFLNILMGYFQLTFEKLVNG